MYLTVLTRLTCRSHPLPRAQGRVADALEGVARLWEGNRDEDVLGCPLREAARACVVGCRYGWEGWERS